jgi:hypothetical protein
MDKNRKNTLDLLGEGAKADIKKIENSGSFLELSISDDAIKKIKEALMDIDGKIKPITKEEVGDIVKLSSQAKDALSIETLKLAQRYASANVMENAKNLSAAASMRRDLILFTSDMADAFAQNGIKGVKVLKSYFINWNPIAIVGVLKDLEEKEGVAGTINAVIGARDPEKVKDEISANPNVLGMQKFIANVSHGFIEIERKIRAVENSIKNAYSKDEIKTLSEKEIPWISKDGSIQVTKLSSVDDKKDFENILKNAENARFDYLKNSIKDDIQNDINAASLFDVPIAIKSLMGDESLHSITEETNIAQKM